MIKKLIMAASPLILLYNAGYLLDAWSNSRLDRWDWIFYLMAIPAAVWSLREFRPDKWDYKALFVLAFTLLLAAGKDLHNTNALCVAAAAGVVWSLVWLLGGWGIAYRALPAVCLLLLGTPSSTYQLALLVSAPVWVAIMLKILLAVLCFVWIWCNRNFGWILKAGDLFFAAAFTVTAFVLVHSEEIYFKGESFVPSFRLHAGEFYGRNIEPDENTKSFFAASDVAQYRYMFNEYDISVLSVHCGSNVHEIHPASHCLRTSQWEINSEKVLELHPYFAVTEIDAEKGNRRILVWVWYSSDEFSTPGFIGFRRHFRPGGNYYTCQISVPVYEEVGASRDVLKKFLNTLEVDE